MLLSGPSLPLGSNVGQGPWEVPPEFTDRMAKYTTRRESLPGATTLMDALLSSLCSLDADVWKKFLSRPALPFILRLLRGLATQPPATQVRGNALGFAPLPSFPDGVVEGGNPAPRVFLWTPFLHCIWFQRMLAALGWPSPKESQKGLCRDCGRALPTCLCVRYAVWYLGLRA